MGLEGLLEEAVLRAVRVVAENDDALKKMAWSYRPRSGLCVAETVGIGGLKYADLSQNRTSDYEFSYEKMLAKKRRRDSHAYMQYFPTLACGPYSPRATLTSSSFALMAQRLLLAHPPNVPWPWNCSASAMPCRLR